MSAFGNMLHWFYDAMSHRKYAGPVCATILLKDGTLLHIDYKNPADRQKAGDTFGRYVGHVVLAPKPGLWGGEAPHPVQPSWTLRLPYEYATREEAAAALYEVLAEAASTELAIQADPAKHLARELANHDWFAAYSDAPGVCGAAESHWRLIQKLAAKVSPDVWDDLLAQHAPKVDAAA